MVQQLAGIGKKERQKLAVVLKAQLPIITPKNSAALLKIDRKQAAQLLAQWAKKGWVFRIKQGVYIPVSLQADNAQVVADEPWVVAYALFEPGYIGGWSAAEYWDLTEQIFNSVMVFSTKKATSSVLEFTGIKLTVKTILPKRLFGTKSIWINSQKVTVSDPSRTVIDAFNDPAVVGGIRMAMDILSRYLKSKDKNLSLLFDYAVQLNNAAVFKRLGFVFEQQHPSERALIKKMRGRLKSGYSQLDPATPSKTLVTSWRLWVPKSWKKGHLVDQS